MILNLKASVYMFGGQIMDQQHILFGMVSSLSLVILGVVLSATALADWGLTLVGLLLMGISVASWLSNRGNSATETLSAAESSDMSPSPQ